MMRNAKRDDERVRVSETGGRRSNGGSGWDDRIHLYLASITPRPDT